MPYLLSPSVPLPVPVGFAMSPAKVTGAVAFVVSKPKLAPDLRPLALIVDRLVSRVWALARPKSFGPPTVTATVAPEVTEMFAGVQLAVLPL